MSMLTEAVHGDAGAPPDVRRTRRTANPWVAFVRRRIIGLVVILVLLATVTFSLVRLIPGDPGIIIGGTASTREDQLAIDHRLGVDQPFLTQYWHYWRDLFHG